MTGGYHGPTSTNSDMISHEGVGARQEARRPPVVMESTLDLLARAKAGEQGAIELLFQRCLPSLRRWARGRLPSYARGLAETQDLVQEAVLRTLHNLDRLRGSTSGRASGLFPAGSGKPDPRRNPSRNTSSRTVRAVRHRAGHLAFAVGTAIGCEGLERYDDALFRLRPVGPRGNRRAH